jgi:hypothetical protein
VGRIFNLLRALANNLLQASAVSLISAPSIDVRIELVARGSVGLIVEGGEADVSQMRSNRLLKK